MKLITSYKGVQFLPPEAENTENNSNEIKNMWDSSKNEKSFDSYGKQSKYEAWWKCPVCGYEWYESIKNFTNRKIKCPKCMERSLAIINDNKTMKYWNWEKNLGLDPEAINRRSMVKAYWICPECGYEWQASVRSVLKKKEKCRKCKSKKKRETETKRVNCFLDTVPELKKEFVKMLNENDDVKMQTTASRKAVLWRCSKCGYEWESTIRTRIARVGNGYQIKPCPACDKQTIGIESNIHANIKYYFKYPVLNEIYSSENNSIPVSELDARYMDNRLTFLCTKHGNYKMTLRSMIDLIRKGRTPCPACRKEENSKSLADAFPDLALDWSNKNEESAAEVKPFSDKVVHWKCHVCGTEWDASIFNRTRGSKKCPKCSTPKKYVDRFPELRNIFDSNTNARTADSLKHKDFKTSFIWICDKHGSYKSKFKSIIAHLKDGKSPCPQCRQETNKASAINHTKKRQATRNITNPLSTNHPDLVKEWSSKNRCSPNEVSEFSRKEAIWKCQKCGNEWNARIIDRARGFKTCPTCYPFGKTKGKYLSEVRPDLKKHYSSENDQPFERISSASAKSVVWVCDNGHKFTKTVANMASRKEFLCPKCAGFIASEDNNLFTNHPDLMKEWDYEANTADGIDPHNVLANSTIIMAHWICPDCSSHYDMVIKERTRRENNEQIACPYCRGKLVNETNSLKATHPDLMKEWSPWENALIEVSADKITDDYYGKAWWICPICKYKYSMSVRVKCLKEKRHQNACPRCNGRLQKRIQFF